MDAFNSQGEYIQAVKAEVADTFAARNYGRPSSVKLAERHTRDGYLFFIAFVHFSCEPQSAESCSFRITVGEGEATINLDNGSYWKVRKYRPNSRTDTLAQQKRLQFQPRLGALPRPTLQRNCMTAVPPEPVAAHYSRHRRVKLVNTARAVLGDPMPQPSPLDIDFPPLGFDAWMEKQPTEVREGYADALSIGDSNLTKQYHGQMQADEIASGARQTEE